MPLGIFGMSEYIYYRYLLTMIVNKSQKAIVITTDVKNGDNDLAPT